MLMARKFKIYIDEEVHSSIADGEQLEINIPPNSEELTVKIMNYWSKPISLNFNDSKKYVIKQNRVSTAATYLLVFFAVLHFITEFTKPIEPPIFLLCAIPFLLLQIYYSTFGRHNVILVEEMMSEI